MRIIKPVEVRRQEILNGAIKVFGEKGYDKTSISDIAAYLKISQGLCYSYFKSKEEIFETAVDVYAQYIVDEMIKIINDSQMGISEKISYISAFTEIEKRNKEYYDFFHGDGSHAIYDKLSLNICRKVCPYVEKLLAGECKKGTIRLKEIKTSAVFLVFGQLGILLDWSIENEEKDKRIKKFLTYILQEIS